LAGAAIRHRPEPPGGYLGLGSRVWGWLLLGDLGAVPVDESVRRAVALAGRLPEAVEADQVSDLLAGAAGAVVPLLRLAQRTGEGRWRELARATGRRLRDRAQVTGVGAGWPSELFPGGIGGLSHGVTGIGWALARLAAATGDGELRELADAGFAREETFYDPAHGWRDARSWLSPEARYGVAWCHGSVGIGMVAADLLARDGGDRWRELLARAVAATWPAGFDWNHTLCHGDLGAWELLHRAWAVGLDLAGQSPDAVAARVLSSLAEHGPTTGMATDVFSPGLVAGHGGLAYQLLRMHPDCDLPSVLLPDPGPG
jgi:lantibiotic modifying enzyme